MGSIFRSLLQYNRRHDLIEAAPIFTRAMTSSLLQTLVSVLSLSPTLSSTLPSTYMAPSTTVTPSICNMTACSSIDKGWTCSNTADTNCQTSSHYCNYHAQGWSGQCVDDKNQRHLDEHQIIHSHTQQNGYPSTSNTPEHCIDLCRSKGYTYAGVEYGYQCFCGNDPPPSSSILPQSQCWYKCYGDPGQYCGGFHTMNVYATEECHCCPPVTEDPEPKTCNSAACSILGQGWTCANTSVMGDNTGCEASSDYCNKVQGWDGQCVEDLGKLHLNFQHVHNHTEDLDGFLTTNNSVTSCVQSCLDAGFTYAAMEDGYQCFCGNDPPSTSLILPQSRCNYRCRGDESQFCGGFRTMNVYATQDLCWCCPPAKPRCVDTGCKSKYAGMDTAAECVNVRQADWKYIDQVYNINTEYEEGLCDTAKNVKDCCRCLKRKNFE